MMRNVEFIHRMIRLKLMYSSIVRRNACWASLVNGSTSDEMNTLNSRWPLLFEFCDCTMCMRSSTIAIRSWMGHMMDLSPNDNCCQLSKLRMKVNQHIILCHFSDFSECKSLRAFCAFKWTFVTVSKHVANQINFHWLKWLFAKVTLVARCIAIVFMLHFFVPLVVSFKIITQMNNIWGFVLMWMRRSDCIKIASHWYFNEYVFPNNKWI